MINRRGYSQPKPSERRQQKEIEEAIKILDGMKGNITKEDLSKELYDIADGDGYEYYDINKAYGQIMGKLNAEIERVINDMNEHIANSGIHKVLYGYAEGEYEEGDIGVIFEADDSDNIKINFRPSVAEGIISPNAGFLYDWTRVRYGNNDVARIRKYPVLDETILPDPAYRSDGNYTSNIADWVYRYYRNSYSDETAYQAAINSTVGKCMDYGFIYGPIWDWNADISTKLIDDDDRNGLTSVKIPLYNKALMINQCDDVELNSTEITVSTGTHNLYPRLKIGAVT